MKIHIHLFALILPLLTACSAEGERPPQALNTAQDSTGTIPAAQIANQPHSLDSLDVYKDPSCGCCQFWIDHAEEAGFQTNIIHPANLSLVKMEQGIAAQYQSCHTAVSPEGYVFEGHVPAKVITRFLSEQPEDAIGLAVPGMPLGSPGMEVGDRFTPYDVLLLKKDGSAEVYQHFSSAAEQF